MRVAIAGAAAALIAVLGLVLTDSKPRESGSNYVAEAGPVTEIAGSGTRCQDGLTIPADTGQVRILLGTYGRPTPGVRVRATVGGRPITSGALPGGLREGHLDVPLRRVERTTSSARVCVHLAGRGRTVLYGSGGVVRLEWLRPGSETWLQLLPTVAHRFGWGKANPFGAWLLLAAGLVLALAWALAARLVVRELLR
jgi:hypothetical protein